MKNNTSAKDYQMYNKLHFVYTDPLHKIDVALEKETEDRKLPDTLSMVAVGIYRHFSSYKADDVVSKYFELSKERTRELDEKNMEIETRKREKRLNFYKSKPSFLSKLFYILDEGDMNEIPKLFDLNKAKP